MPRAPIRTVLVAGLALGTLLIATPVRAEVNALEITLFMPCDRETAERAIAAVEQVPGVENVVAAEGDLRVRILLGPEFGDDPLSLVQLLWEMKIYPNRIYLEAGGRFEESGARLRVAPERAFDIADPVSAAATAAERVWVRAEVLDWIEDRIPPRDKQYTLRIEELEIVRSP